MTDKPTKAASASEPQPQRTPDGILVPLGVEFPGEHIVFEPEWEFGDIDGIGRAIAGTATSIDLILRKAKSWKITDRKGNAIVFDREALLKDHTPLYGISSKKARAMSFVAYTAYLESAKPDPLPS